MTTRTTSNFADLLSWGYSTVHKRNPAIACSDPFSKHHLALHLNISPDGTLPTHGTKAPGRFQIVHTKIKVVVTIAGWMNTLGELLQSCDLQAPIKGHGPMGFQFQDVAPCSF